jgi:hypothetical protein
VAEGREQDLVVQRLEGELLVYDTASNEAHCLSGVGAAEFEAAADEVSRRDVLRKMALAGVAAAGTGALLKTIVAPTAAQAQSIACGTGGLICNASQTCCGNGQGGFPFACCDNNSQVCVGGLACVTSDRAAKRDLVAVRPARVISILA